MTSQDMADVLGVTRSHVGRLVRSHGLPALKLRGAYNGILVADRADFSRWLRDVWPTIKPRGVPRKGTATTEDESTRGAS